MQDCFKQVFLVLVEEGQLSTHHFKQHHTQPPPINFSAIVVVKENLGTYKIKSIQENATIGSILEYTGISR